MEDMRAIVADLTRERGDESGAEAGTGAPSLPPAGVTTPSIKVTKANIPVDWDLFEDPISGSQRETAGKPTEERMDVEIVKPVTATTTSSISATKPGKGKRNDKQIEQIEQIEDINLKIKDLVRRKRELKREADMERSDAGSEGPSRSLEKPLPQRVPKAKPRIISNIQTVPPKSVEKKGIRKTFPADALKKARSSISLDSLNITKTKIRKAANGSLLIEVMGPGGAEKALRLRDQLQEVLKDEARVTRPVTKGEIRLIGLHDATSPDEVISAVSGYGKCLNKDVKVGPIHPMRNGLFTVWIQCPLGAAIKIANFGKISVGWTQVRVDLLNNRPSQCFKCWKFGHLKHACPSKEDFGGSCFRCGGEGHIARNCGAPPACKVCKLDGRAFNHRLGSNLCSATTVSARIRPNPTTLVPTSSVNINRSRRALDLLMHQARELGAGLLLVSEPRDIVPSDKWLVSLDGSSAIYFDPNFINLRFRLAKRGDRFVAAYCGPYLFISTYISPNLSLREYDTFLNELSAILSSHADKVVVAGNFNAKANIWGSNVTNQRDLQVIRLAAERDLRIVNVGDTPTCVRHQGSSIIDLTWSSSDLFPLIYNWHVKEEMEWLSDHVCICFDVCTGRPNLPPARGSNRRWNLRKFDRDFFRAALIWGSRNPELKDVHNLSQLIRDLDKLMEEACDASAPRIGPRRKAYWWNESVAILRTTFERKNMRLEINRLKAKAWQELIESIDKDPWGLSYKLVLGKLRPAAPGLSELLEHDASSNLLDSLFPRNNLPNPVGDWSNFVWSNDWSISLEEVCNALKKGSSSLSKAPGPFA
ncbi:reverse transcriptase [Lasius niger]|uniref:Reverse transcriptase n=1 Tax=Lasius niger TaxID=67767 RepID=A0A0J7NJV1_LASNI|nr:reverse transcriptase [Lasius niger]